MKILRETIQVKSKGNRPTFHMLTKQVKDIVEKSGVVLGFCQVYSRHTTCSVILEEDSIDRSYSGLTFLQQDLTDIFEKIIPTCRKEGQYMHPGPKASDFAADHGEDKPGSLNTDAHLRSSIIGRSESVPIVEGKLDLGEFGHIFFIDFDHTRARERQVSVLIVGE